MPIIYLCVTIKSKAANANRGVGSENFRLLVPGFKVLEPSAKVNRSRNTQSP